MNQPAFKLKHNYSGSDWLRGWYKKPISPLGEVVADLLGYVWRGLYHIEHAAGKVDWSHNQSIVILLDHGYGLSTFDGSELTELVVLAHDLCLRVDISGHGMSRIRILFTARKPGATDMFERHPMLDGAIERIRSGVGVVRVTNNKEIK